MAYSLHETIVPSFEMFCRFLRCITPDFDQLATRLPSLTLPRNASLREDIRNAWSQATAFTFVEALSLQELELRALAFRCMGPANVFRAAGAKKIDSEDIERRFERVVGGKIVETGTRTETYELYEVKPEALNLEKNRNPVRAIRCWCPSTSEEHWLLVQRPATRGRWRDNAFITETAPDTPVSAIASTIITNVTNPKKLYRQGDLIVIATGDEAPEWGQFEPMSAEQYKSLTYVET